MIDDWMAYLDSWHFSDHFSYINYFHLNYGLKDMNFRSFINFLDYFIYLIPTLSKTVSDDVRVTSA